jgi:DNA (cytosine-5)-methyltransferase 1
MDKQIHLGEKYLGKLDLDSEDIQQRIGKGPIKTHVSLFSGCGGLDLGFAEAGIQTRIMIEWEHSACETLRHNFLWKYLKERKDHEGKLCWNSKEEMKKQITWYHDEEPVIMERDICEVTSQEIMEKGNLKIGECSIISGGFPCQGFSLAGRRMMDDPRNKLYKQFVRITDDLKPASIMGENVQGIVSMGKGEVIQQICEDFANLGYNITWDLLDAANYGVPQHRVRMILIGFRVDAMKFEGERPSFHIAATPGTIQHPSFFKERIKRWKNKSLLERIEKDPRCRFRTKEEETWHTCSFKEEKNKSKQEVKNGTILQANQSE